MRLLLLGGPKFVGFALIEAALARGDEVTTFNRGQTHPERFPETRLWLHGHLHTPFDYLVSAGDHQIRVVCNPLGYPMARVRRRVGIQVIEIGA